MVDAKEVSYKLSRRYTVTYRFESCPDNKK